MWNSPLVILWLFVGVPALMIWLARRHAAAERRAEDLERRVARLDREVEKISRASPPPAEEPSLAPPETEPTPFEPPLWETTVTMTATDTTPTAETLPPALPPMSPVQSESPHRHVPPPLPPVAAKPAINWENFLGVKLFAWVGGFLLFLAAAFFIKYSFDNGLISPQLRVALTYLTGAGLLVGALWMKRERYAATVQTLCAAAVLIFYANTFACHSYYHYLGAMPTFGVMALVTAVAFALAVRLNAQVVAVLGLLGGFLTPLLLSTGEDRAVGLFAYLALLNLGLIAIALRQRWNYLVSLGCAATAVMQLGWTVKFFAVEKYPVAVGVFVGFAVVFAVAHAFACRWKREDWFTAGPALAAPAVALLFAFFILVHPFRDLAARPGALFGFVFVIDLIVLALAWTRKELRLAQLGGGAAAFLLLGLWTSEFLTDDLLNWALALSLIFGVLHSIFPVVVERRHPAGQPLWLAHLFPPLVLLMMLLPLFKIAAGSMLIWPVVLLVDLLAIALAVLTASLFAIVSVLVLTMFVAFCWIFRVPPELTHLPEMLFVVGGFAVLFFAAGIFAGRKILAKMSASGGSAGSPATDPLQKLFGEQSLAHLPALSAVLPFALLTMMTMRLPLANPSPVFGLAALLLVLMLGVVRFYAFDALAGVGLLCVWLLEFTWHHGHFSVETPGVPFAWYLGFGAVLFLFPFVFRQRFAGRMIPWAASALVWPLQFTLIYDVVKKAWPNDYMGLVPAAFAVPTLISVVFLVKSIPADSPKRNTQLALFGGVALFFITLIFPVQFNNQWLTLAWALEGVALLWLFHRVPHVGLRVVGTALLAVAFVRLALNPAVLEYHERTGRPILNWWLYSYGTVTACFFAAARLATPPHDKLGTLRLPPLFCTLGTVLAFLLLNIEIADFFSKGTRLQFTFHGEFAEDMTYSLAWGLFALVLLGIGLWKNITAARYAGLALLVVTLVKLFLHDLWRLGGLFRIGSLIGLAVVLMVVSFIYQRFLSAQAGKEEPK